MSKRLNKRQLRELEELEALKAAQKSSTPDAEVSEEEEDEDDGVPKEATAFNPFAALEGDNEPEPEDEEEEEEAAPTVVKKKNKKKKPKKKKTAVAAVVEDEPSTSGSTPKGKKKKGGASSRTETPDLDGMDEVDRALAELKLKYGEEPERAPQAGPSQPSESRSSLAFRNVLGVDPKNLDADAELRRFFGSKVIASAAPTGGRRGTPSKVRYTLAKPKPQYPPPTSLAGLNMKEMSHDDVLDLYDRRGWVQEDTGERWYTFEHSPAWREVERQFLGAVRSHGEWW